MYEELRGDEVVACVHRVALSRGSPFRLETPPETPEMARRRRAAGEHRRTVNALLREAHPQAHRGDDELRTTALMREGAETILSPRLAPDVVGRRTASVHVLVRVGRRMDAFTYAPVLIKNHEVIEHSSTRRALRGSLEKLRPTEAEFVDGVGVRPSPSMTRSGLALAQATRILDALGHGDDGARVGIVDRQRQLWWLELDAASYPRFNLTAYENRYLERLDVLNAHDEWRLRGGAFPTAPYWHRDCPECPFRSSCEAQLETIDDVSLVRFTTFDQQLLLREHGVATRSQLSRLDPERARRARHRALNPLDVHQREDVLGRSIDKLDELIYRARAHERATSLRTVASSLVGCATADVEVDVDMESDGESTYLWGALVSVNEPTAGVTAGFRAFVTWAPLSHDEEAANFAEFWQWLETVRHACASQGRSFAAYCFWAQAENSAMNRAVTPPVAGGPTMSDVTTFRQRSPSQWIDLHDIVKGQIQTEGPLGLKQLASATGFRWRDPTPGGEASLVWYDAATRNDSVAARQARTRLLEYNEDDCRATKALRDWLNGPARLLPSRDDPL